MSEAAELQLAVAPDGDQQSAWITAIAGGDRQAFEALYKEFAPRIYRFALRLIQDQGKAEEVVNDTMVEVWKSADRFEGRSSPSTWILGIARHRTLNAVRGKTLYLTDIDAAGEIAGDESTAADSIDRAGLNQHLRAAIQKLSPEHREVIELTFFGEMPYQRIAEITGVPENTVKTRMYHAKKKLEPVLARYMRTGGLQ